MSWSMGSVIMSEIISNLKDKIPDDKIRQEIYEVLIPSFENNDCDTLYECSDEDHSFALAYKEVSFFVNEEDEDYEEEVHYEDE